MTKRGWRTVASGAAATLFGVSSLITGCMTMPEWAGSIGVAVRGGQPVIVLAICQHYVEEVRIVLGREGLRPEQSNPEVGVWETNGRLSTPAELNLSAPGDIWKTRSTLVLARDKRYIVSARARGGDEAASTGQVDFFGRDLAAMREGVVYQSMYRRDGDGLVGYPADQFTPMVCSRGASTPSAVVTLTH